MLLSGPPGIGKTTVAKDICNQLGSDYYVINGSDEGRFLTRFGTVRRTSHLQSLLQVTRNIKSSSLTKQTIPLPMYSSFSERVLRSSPETAGLSLPVITKTKLSTLYIVGVLLLISQLIKRQTNNSRTILRKIKFYSRRRKSRGR